ncbi:unnamed protein product [Closterium sp. NIES-65]|nr:unnamed protein product [Closterium sp. NIES-65]
MSRISSSYGVEWSGVDRDWIHRDGKHERENWKEILEADKGVQDEGEAEEAEEEEEDPVCPLCIEHLDETEVRFRPCPCGYRVCLFCYERIKLELNSLCPSCRTPYGVPQPPSPSAADKPAATARAATGKKVKGAANGRVTGGSGGLESSGKAGERGRGGGGGSVVVGYGGGGSWGGGGGVVVVRTSVGPGKLTGSGGTGRADILAGSTNGIAAAAAAAAAAAVGGAGVGTGGGVAVGAAGAAFAGIGSGFGGMMGGMRGFNPPISAMASSPLMQLSPSSPLTALALLSTHPYASQPLCIHPLSLFPRNPPLRPLHHSFPSPLLLHILLKVRF